MTSTGECYLASDATSGVPLNPMTSSELLEKVRRCFSTSRMSDFFDRVRLVQLERETSIATSLRELCES